MLTTHSLKLEKIIESHLSMLLQTVSYILKSTMAYRPINEAPFTCPEIWKFGYSIDY